MLAPGTTSPEIRHGAEQTELRVHEIHARERVGTFPVGDGAGSERPVSVELSQLIDHRHRVSSEAGRREWVHTSIRNIGGAIARLPVGARLRRSPRREPSPGQFRRIELELPRNRVALQSTERSRVDRNPGVHGSRVDRSRVHGSRVDRPCIHGSRVDRPCIDRSRVERSGIHRSRVDRSRIHRSCVELLASVRFPGISGGAGKSVPDVSGAASARRPCINLEADRVGITSTVVDRARAYHRSGVVRCARSGAAAHRDH